MAGDALMVDGDAAMRSGGAISSDNPTCCCKGGPCGTNIGPGCPCAVGCNGTITNVQMLRYPGPQVVFQHFQNCCCPDPGQTAEYVKFRFDVSVYLSDGTLVQTYHADGEGPGSGFPVHIEQVNVTSGTTFTDDVNATAISGGACMAGLGIQGVSVPLVPWFNQACHAEPTSYLAGTSYRDCTRLTEDNLEFRVPLRFPCDPTFIPYLTFRRSQQIEVTWACDRVPNCERGACCCNGDCYDQVSPSECASMGGVFKGGDCVDADCRFQNPRVKGACCLPSGSCISTSESNCQRLGGEYQGDRVECGAVFCPPPPTWGCCLPSNACIEATEQECRDQQGRWFEGLHCPNIVCSAPVLGGCCEFGGFCSLLTATQCAAIPEAFYKGDFTNCDGNMPCAGACCQPDGQGGRVCIENNTPQICAVVGGVFLGIGSTCDPNPCVSNPMRGTEAYL